MALAELFKIYPNKNAELRAISKACYEFGYTIAMEPSANQSLHLDEHALGRQRQYVSIARGMLQAMHARPIPDMPAIHPLQLPINLSAPYKQFTEDNVPLNEDTELLAQDWLFIAVALAKSQSAALAGSLITADYTRATNMLDVITQYLNEIENRPVVDVPETAFPGAPLTEAGGSNT